MLSASLLSISSVNRRKASLSVTRRTSSSMSARYVSTVLAKVIPASSVGCTVVMASA